MALSLAQNIKDVDIVANFNEIRCSNKCVLKTTELGKKSGLPVYKKFNVKEITKNQTKLQKKPTKRRLTFDHTVPVQALKKKARISKKSCDSQKRCK